MKDKKEKIRKDVLSVIETEIDTKEKFILQKIKRKLDKGKVTIINEKDKDKIVKTVKKIDKFYDDDANTIYTTEDSAQKEIQKYIKKFDKIIDLLNIQVDNLKELMDVVRSKKELSNSEKIRIFDQTLCDVTQNDIIYQILLLSRNIKAKKILRERWKQRLYIR